MSPTRNDIRNDITTNLLPPAAPPQPASTRRNDIRNDNQPTTTCPVCHDAFTPIRRQRYCTPACRQAAWRARHHTPRPTLVVPPATPRRAVTIYQCPTCEARYLAQQWCPDCNRPCTRVDLGGLCPHCDEPVTISDLLGQPATNP